MSFPLYVFYVVILKNEDFGFRLQDTETKLEKINQTYVILLPVSFRLEVCQFQKFFLEYIFESYCPVNQLKKKILLHIYFVLPRITSIAQL